MKERVVIFLGITLKELAEISGYSISTISRVVSNKGNVKKETQEDIERLLDEYHYRTSIMELRNQRRKQNTILIVITDLEDHWLTEQAKGIQGEALRQGYDSLIAVSNHSVKEEEKYVQMAIQNQYAGIVLINVCGGENLADLLEKSEMPVVFLNQEIKYAGFDSVTVDNYQSAYILTSHLAERGHRKIIFITDDCGRTIHQERCRGYEDAMRDHKLFVTKNNILVGNDNIESGYKIGEELIKKGLEFTAVVCGSYWIAFGLMNMLRDYGVRVPEDLSVVCCDNFFHTEYLDITTTKFDKIENMGRRAMELLLAKIKGEKTGDGSIIYRPKLIERKSVKKI